MRVEHLVGLVVSDAALKMTMIFIELQVLRYVDKYYLCQAPTHFLWLLFCFLSHSYLNFCAELLRFGDRHFYGDWWSVALKDLWHRFLARVNIVLLTQFFFKGMPQPWFLSGRTGASLARSGVTGVCNITVFKLIWNFSSVALRTNTTLQFFFVFHVCVVLLTQDTYTAGWWRIWWLRHTQSYWSSWCLLLFVRYNGKEMLSAIGHKIIGMMSLFVMLFTQ